MKNSAPHLEQFFLRDVLFFLVPLASLGKQRGGLLPEPDERVQQLFFVNVELHEIGVKPNPLVKRDEARLVRIHALEVSPRLRFGHLNKRRQKSGGWGLL